METFYLNVTEDVRLCCRIQEPECTPRAVVQIIHGVAEHMERYEEFADYLSSHGFLVVGADHPGHGKTETTDKLGFLTGGWQGTVECIHALWQHTKERHPDIPYFMLGHSMGSFLLRTYLFDSRCSIDGAILSGTGWQPGALLVAGKAVQRIEKARIGHGRVSALLNTLMFGSYNKAFSPNRTTHDWLCTDDAVVDKYVADPLCGFPVTVQLCGEMFHGLTQIQKFSNLEKMDPDIPVLFAAGTNDPVGNMGKGVLQTVRAFQNCHVKDITVNLYPEMRHEILNEKQRFSVFNDIIDWISARI